MALQLLPPPPNTALVDEPQRDSIWRRWLEQLFTRLSDAGQINHNTLLNLQGGTTNEYYHLTAAQHSTVTSFGTFNANRVLITGVTSSITTDPGFQVNATSVVFPLTAPSRVYANFTSTISSGNFVALTAETVNGSASSGSQNLFGSVYSVTHDTTLGTTGALRGSFARVQSASSATGGVSAIGALTARIDWNSVANVTSAVGVETVITLDAAAFVNNIRGISHGIVTNGGGATVSTHTCYDTLAQTVGNQLYGFRGQIAASSTRFNLFMDGTAQNAIVGNTKFGAITAPAAAVDISGALLASSSATALTFIPTGATSPSNGMYLPAANELGWGTNSAKRLQLSSTGTLYGTALHNNAGPVTGTTNQYIASGTYTPTISSIANLDAVTSFVAQWIRVGNVVNVSGKVQIDPTAPATLTRLGFSLPIASNLANEEDCAGTAFASGIAGQGAAIRAEATNDQAEMAYISGDVTVQPMQYIYQYEIL